MILKEKLCDFKYGRYVFWCVWKLIINCFIFVFFLNYYLRLFIELYYCLWYGFKFIIYMILVFEEYIVILYYVFIVDMIS